MSIKIRQALETSVAAISSNIDTVWENTSYKPVANVNYQSVSILFIPDDNVISDYVRYEGYVYIRLHFCNIGKGVKDIHARAATILNTFKKGSVHSKDGIDCIIQRTPEFNLEGVVSDRFVGLIVVQFYTSFTS